MFATLVVAAIAAPVVTPVPSVARAALSGPAERFAADVVAGIDRGGAVRELAIDYRDQGPALEVVVSDGHAARRHVLAYSEDGSIAIEYRAYDVAPPADDRVYGAADELVRKLRAAAPGVLTEECGSFSVEIGTDAVWLDDANYYVVRTRAAGDGADTVVADELTRALAAGFDLIDVRGSRDGDDPVIELWLGGDTWRVIHVVTDKRGRVAVVEVRDRPASMAYQTYRFRKQLLGELRVGRALHSLTLEPTASGGQRLVGVMRAGVRFTVEPDEFRQEEVGCGC